METIYLDEVSIWDLNADDNSQKKQEVINNINNGQQYAVKVGDKQHQVLINAKGDLFISGLNNEH